METTNYPSQGMNATNTKARAEAEHRLHQSAATHGKLKVIGVYVNNKTKVDVECLSCGKQWGIYPKNVHAGNGCKSCARKVPAEELERRRIAKELDKAERSAVRAANLLETQRKRVFESAAKFSSRAEWQKNNKYTYELACKRGWKDEACAHMEALQRPPYTKDECLELAKQYSSRSQFQNGSGGAYACASKNGWLAECVAHMPSRTTAKDGIPSQVYVLEHLLNDGSTIVNVGITTRPLTARYVSDELRSTSRRYVLPLRDGAKAWELEAEVHKQLKDAALGTTVPQLPSKRSSDELYSLPFEVAVEQLQVCALGMSAVAAL